LRTAGPPGPARPARPGLLAARASALRHHACGRLFERSERSERSEFGHRPARRASQGKQSALCPHPARRLALADAGTRKRTSANDRNGPRADFAFQSCERNLVWALGRVGACTRLLAGTVRGVPFAEHSAREAVPLRVHCAQEPWRSAQAVISSTTLPDTGSVTPRPLPRSLRSARKLSSIAIICGRAAARLSNESHSPTTA